jgi:hypothetical protein
VISFEYFLFAKASHSLNCDEHFYLQKIMAICNNCYNNRQITTFSQMSTLQKMALHYFISLHSIEGTTPEDHIFSTLTRISWGIEWCQLTDYWIRISMWALSGLLPVNWLAPKFNATKFLSTWELHLSIDWKTNQKLSTLSRILCNMRTAKNKRKHISEVWTH